jgi:predicted CXXCH cytochrome family protein
VLAAALLVAAPGWGENDEAVEACLECHGDDGATMTLGDGTEMALYVDGEAFASSVHGGQLNCTDCHEAYDQEHPEGQSFPGRRQYVIAHYETCKKCHFDTYTRTLESVHYEFLKQGRTDAPVCTDCHGAHDVHDPHRKRTMVAKSCARCHQPVYEQYAKSVHGRALVEDDNQDVPACADCHTHHSIEHPQTARFRLASPEACIHCHGDAERMARYDIPTDVATTYLADFHGVTASLSRDARGKQVVVTCVDCHGVHDIASPALVGEPAMKARVDAVCRGCHQGAGTDFPAAWLSHYRPSLRHAPLVYLVDMFYKFFIPFMILGLFLQVLLHLYRVAVRR